MTHQIVPRPFAFEGHEIRIAHDDGQVWFAAKDVCEALEISWRGSTLDSIKDEWKGMREFRTPGGMQSLTVISEPALYKLAFRSRKDEAERFTDWVASEVLPSIRQTGSYSVQPAAELSPLDLFRQMLTAYEAQERRVAAIETGQAHLEQRFDNSPISVDGAKAGVIHGLLRELASVLGRNYILAYGSFKNHYRIGKYDQLPMHLYDEAVERVREWIRTAESNQGRLLS